VVYLLNDNKLDVNKFIEDLSKPDSDIREHHSIDLSNNDLSYQNVYDICKCLYKANTIRNLAKSVSFDLSNTKIGDDVLALLERFSRVIPITELSLNDNYITDKSIPSICELLDQYTLKSLNLSHNKLTNKTANAIINENNLNISVRIDNNKEVSKRIMSMFDEKNRLNRTKEKNMDDYGTGAMMILGFIFTAVFVTLGLLLFVSLPHTPLLAIGTLLIISLTIPAIVASGFIGQKFANWKNKALENEFQAKRDRVDLESEFDINHNEALVVSKINDAATPGENNRNNLSLDTAKSYSGSVVSSLPWRSNSKQVKTDEKAGTKIEKTIKK